MCVIVIKANKTDRMHSTDGARIGRLILNYLSDSMTAEEREELTAWRGASMGNQTVFERMTSPEFMEETLARLERDEQATFREWERILSRTAGRKRNPLTRYFRYAAALLMVAGAGFALSVLLEGPGATVDSPLAGIERYQEHPVLILPDGTSVELDEKHADEVLECRDLGMAWADSSGVQPVDSREAIEFHTLKIPRGATRILKLADSTLVYLNADSELVFPSRFAANERKVFLRKGEAYFKVTRDTGKPFLVDVGPVSVRVLGTTFCVRAYEDEHNIRTILESGSVQVATHGQTVTLKPATQASFDLGRGVITVADADPDLMLSWTRNRLAYDNTPLRDILRDLARIYSFTAEFADSTAGDIPFSINILKDDAFDEILQLIERTGKVRFDIENHVVSVKCVP